MKSDEPVLIPDIPETAIKPIRHKSENGHQITRSLSVGSPQVKKRSPVIRKTKSLEILPSDGHVVKKLTNSPRKDDLISAFYKAKVSLPGLFSNKVFLIIQYIFPLLDFATDCVNAGSDN